MSYVVNDQEPSGSEKDQRPQSSLQGAVFSNFFFFWLRWVFVFGKWLSLVAARRVYSSFWCTGFSLRWLLLLRSTGSRCTGFSSCGMGLVAPSHVESSLIRDWTGVPCIGNGFLSTGPSGKSFSKHFWWWNHYQNKIRYTATPTHIYYLWFTYKY